MAARLRAVVQVYCCVCKDTRRTSGVRGSIVAAYPHVAAPLMDMQGGADNMEVVAICRSPSRKAPPVTSLLGFLACGPHLCTLTTPCFTISMGRLHHLRTFLGPSHARCFNAALLPPPSHCLGRVKLSLLVEITNLNNCAVTYHQCEHTRLCGSTVQRHKRCIGPRRACLGLETTRQ